MSEVRSDIDLSVLDRKKRPAQLARPKRRALKLIVPGVLVLGFAAVLVTSLGDVLRGRTRVSVLRPRTSRSVAAAEGSAVLQAAGWVEPDPFPLRVGALEGGVVRDLLVQESDRVAAGDPVARLVDDDAKLALRAADAALARAQAALAKADMQARFAKESFDAAIELTESEQVAAAEAAGKEAESEHRRQSVVQGEAQSRIAEIELATQKHLDAQGAAGPWQVELAAAKVDEARGGLAVMRADAALAAAEAERARARFRRVAKDRELRIEDRLRVETAQREVDLARAEAAAAQSARDRAALALERMTVRAPAAGVVLTRNAAPGTVVGPEGDQAAICTLWDPEHVRVRVDVPQADIHRAQVGQRVLVLSEARPGRPYAGEVVRIVQQADIQKVTVQLHVRITDADGLLHPEMLVQARLLAAAPESRPEGSPAALATAVQIPARLLMPDDTVWVVAPAALRAELRKVTPGERAGDWVEIRSGINVSDKLIDEGRGELREGAPIAIDKEGS
jgi:HlyD family secretion protein